MKLINYSLAAGRNGILYAGLMGLCAGIGLSFFWENEIIDVVILLIMFAPVCAIAGLVAGFPIFFLSGLVVFSINSLRSSPRTSFAVVGALVSFAPSLSYVWYVADIDIISALLGDKGAYSVLIPVPVASLVAGTLVGKRMTGRG